MTELATSKESFKEADDDGFRACEYCIFCDYATELPTGIGLCRKNPPIMLGNSVNGYWPRVKFTDWCGSYVTDPDFEINP